VLRRIVRATQDFAQGSQRCAVTDPVMVFNLDMQLDVAIEVRGEIVSDRIL
jgi:hypothetical protein